METQNPTITQIIKQLLSDPRVVDVVTTVLVEMLQDPTHVDENAVAQTVEQPTSQPTQESDIRQSQEYIGYSAKTDAQLRANYAYRIKHNNEFTPAFQAILTDRFQTYNQEQKKFTGHGGKRAQETKSVTPTIQPVAPVSESKPATTQKKTQKVIDWDSKTKPQLYAAYNYRIKHNIPFEPDFEAALIKHLPGYDSTKKAFKGHGDKRAQVTKSVTPSIQPVAQTTQPKKKERIINWNEKPNAILRRAYEHRKHTGIDDKLNATLAKRFPDEYDPVAHKFIKKVKLHDFATKRPQKSASVPTVTQRHAVAPVKKETSVENTAQLSVTLKLVKQSLDVAYYNVYINGKKILANHADTELKLFANGTILGIRGIVTNDSNLPQRPLWLIYKTDMTKLKWAGYTKFTKYDVYVQHIGTSESNINLSLSDGTMRQLVIEKLKQQAGLTRFEIER